MSESETSTYRVLEFYSGLGGWSCALRGSHTLSPHTQWEVVGAFDLSLVANDVYAANHGLRPSPRSVETLTAAQLDLLSAQLWVLSPPCQPFTRNNTTACRDSVDPRASSFQHLLTQLAAMHTPPRAIALENVQGFERSQVCAQWRATLSKMGYRFEEMLLSPEQFGVPNARPRYYSIAWRETDPHTGAHTGESAELTQTLLTTLGEEHTQTVRRKLSEYLENDLNDEELRAHLVPKSLIASKSAAWCFDIRDAESDFSACFTKSYARFVRGTGSVLLFRTHTPLCEDFAGLESIAADAEREKEKERVNEGEAEKKKSSSLGEEESDERHAKARKLDKDITLSTSEGKETTDNAVCEREGVKEREREFDPQWWRRYTHTHTVTHTDTEAQTHTHTQTYTYLRYFTPRELLNLFGFPVEYVFPSSVSRKKRYELIGNSVNVTVVRLLLNRLFAKAKM